jgi:acetylornithine deacetylase/succinyl-diaminopimelate desuccinylase-like protein
MLRELQAFLSIPSISTDPSRDADTRRAADWVGKQLEDLGCSPVEYLGSDTHPVVWAEGPRVPGKPVVLVYGHYDVQPPDPLDLWDSPPFDPTVRNGDLFARGATDDKGQVFSIIKAFEAVTQNGRAPVNVRFLIEGEEESGSQVISEILAREPARVKADAVLVADMPYYAPGWPAVETALRGICYGEITVRTLEGE